MTAQEGLDRISLRRRCDPAHRISVRVIHLKTWQTGWAGNSDQAHEVEREKGVSNVASRPARRA